MLETSLNKSVSPRPPSANNLVGCAPSQVTGLISTSFEGASPKLRLAVSSMQDV